MIYDKSIKIPIITPFNWEGFRKEEQYRNVEDEYIPKYHNSDVVYFQFKSIIQKAFKLRIRDCYGIEVATFTFSSRTYSLSKYPYKYELYVPFMYANGYYYFEIYVESENKVYADCEFIEIADECLFEMPFEGYNDFDKDGFIYTEPTGTLIETDSTIGKGYFQIEGDEIFIGVDVANSYTVELEKDPSFDDDTLQPKYNFNGYNELTFARRTDNIPYRILIKDGDTLLAYSNWFITYPVYTDVNGSLVTSYELQAQNRTFIRVEANFRPDGFKPISTRKSFTEQDQDQRTTSSIEGEVEQLTIGRNGIPRWIQKKMNRFLGLNHIYNQGTEYSVVSEIEYGVEKENLESGFAIMIVDMQKTKHEEYEGHSVDSILVNENFNPLGDENNNYLTL